MKSKKALSIVFFSVCLFVIGSTFKTFPVTPGSFQKQISSTKDKFKDYLNLIQKSQSFSQIIQAFKAAKFSAKELNELEKILSKPPYSTKIQQLKKRFFEAEERIGKNAADQKFRTILNQEKRTVSQKQQRVLNRLNQTTLNKFNRMKTSSKSSMKPVRLNNLTSAMRTTFRARAAFLGTTSDEDRPAIDRISPNPCNPGGVISILGENFGSSRGNGSVTLLMEDGYVLCPVSRWRDGYIDASLPAFISSVIGEGEMDALIWVKPNDRDFGPTAELRISPGEERTIPEITSLSSGELMPGQLLLIEGNNFLSSSGQVRFRIDSLGRTIDGDIHHWADNFITVYLPDDLEGFAEDEWRARVEVTNSRGNTATSTTFVDFVPVMVTEVLRSLLMYSRNERDDPSSRDFTVFDYTMINGWRVTDSSLELIRNWSQEGGSVNIEFLEQPPVGSSSPRAVVRLTPGDPGWGHGSSSYIHCNVYVTIEGPRGMAYH